MAALFVFLMITKKAVGINPHRLFYLSFLDPVPVVLSPRPEAYAFAKDKPLTLLNGGNLLHLLNKHGYKAKIDLKEAKQMLLESQSDS